MYVIKGYWDDNEAAYFVDVNKKTPNSLAIVHLTTDVDSATKFNTIKKAEEKLKFINPIIFKIYPVCPKCHKDYTGHPAISRRDNKTEICSDCGTLEALNDFLKIQER